MDSRKNEIVLNATTVTKPVDLCLRNWLTRKGLCIWMEQDPTQLFTKAYEVLAAVVTNDGTQT